MDNFEAAWQIFPRKVAKAHARKMWARLTEDQQFAALHALPIHVRYWEIAGRDIERIPHFGSWLGGERWEDELETPATKDPNAEWWRSASGIEARARERGIQARAGESHDALKARILAMEKA